MHIHVTLFAHSLHIPHILCTCKESPTIPSYFLLDAFTKSSLLCKLFFSDTLWALVWTFFWGIPCTFFAHSLLVKGMCNWSLLYERSYSYSLHIHLLFLSHLYKLSWHSWHFANARNLYIFRTLFQHSLDILCTWKECATGAYCIPYAYISHNPFTFLSNLVKFSAQCKECGRSVQWEFFACILFLTSNP